MIRTILVATDGSGHARKAVSLASDLAAKYGARLAIVHVLMTDASSETLAALVSQRAIGKRLWNRLNSYEVEVYGTMAGADMSVGYPRIPAPNDVLEAVGRHLLSRAEAIAAKSDVKAISTRLVGGDAADAIIEAGREEQADMIVLGSRGLGNLQGLFLGSVSHKVAARSDVTCVTVT